MNLYLCLLVVVTSVFAAPHEPAAPSAIPYSDALARSTMIQMSAAAYSTTPANCVNKQANGKLKRQVTARCDPTSLLTKDTCSGFSATMNNAIILSFRGTDEGYQLLMEADESILKNDTAWVAGGRVSMYFNNGFFDIWNKGMKDDFSALASANPKANLYVTGHSLGGAMAALAASYISYQKLFPANKIYLYTFGEPRVGDKGFAASIDRDVLTAYRVTHSHDIVPHIPFENMEGFYHHKSEVFYKENMNAGAKFFVCSDIDESTFCSDGNLLPNDSVKDHLHYFEYDVSAYGASGC